MTKPRTIRWALLAAALLAAGGYVAWRHDLARPRTEQAGSPQKSRNGAPSSPVPVKIATVEKADFPVYLTGLGNVQGFNTVVVRTRVDGQVNRIAFTEGQFVKQGDILAEIDPRPFQAVFDQANAKKAQDQANLAN